MLRGRASIAAYNRRPMTTTATATRFRYGWIVLAVGAFVILIGAGTRAAPGALL